MPTTRCVAVYGNTLALAGIAIALQQRPELRIVTLEAESGNLAQQLEQFSPQVIIFDQGQTNVRSVLACLAQSDNLLAIGVEANSNQMVLWSSQSVRALTMVDLVQAILAPPD